MSEAWVIFEVPIKNSELYAEAKPELIQKSKKLIWFLPWGDFMRQSNFVEFKHIALNSLKRKSYRDSVNKEKIK